MSTRLLLLKWPAICALLCTLGQESGAPSGFDYARWVSFELFHPGEEAVDSTLGDVHWESAEVHAPATGGLRTLLERHHFYPDPESLGLLYALNPGLSLESLGGMPMITVPIMLGEAAELPFEKGYRVRVTVAPKYKLAFAEDVNRLIDLLASDRSQLAELDPERYRSNWERARSILVGMRTLRTAFNRRLSTLGPEAVHGLSRDAAYLVWTIGEWDRERRLPSREEEANLKTIESTVDLRLTSLKETWGPKRLPAPPRQEEVVVRVFSKGKEVNGLQVYYDYKGFRGTRPPYQFGRYTSPTGKWLDVANYVVWAGKPGSSKPITEVKPVEVRWRGREQRSPIEIDLSVL